VLDLPDPVVLARNAARPGRQVPDTIVTRQLERVRATVDGGVLATEGYRLVAHLRSPAEVDALVIRRAIGGAA
jgi:predicted kinase